MFRLILLWFLVIGFLILSRLARKKSHSLHDRRDRIIKRLKRINHSRE